MSDLEESLFLTAVGVELKNASKKFPFPNPNIAALMEEVGELAQAFLQNKPYSEIYKEAVQVATMAARCAIEGDPQFNKEKA